MGLLDRFFGPPSKDKFARMFVRAIQQAGETLAMDYDAKEFHLIIGGDKKSVFYLDNIYREFSSAPSEKRKEILSNFVKGYLSYRKEIPANLDDLGPDLLPAVRNRS